MKSNQEQLKEILEQMNSMSHVDLNQIPNIELYMDQVTTFMDEHLASTRRYPEDKVLTKTMINNYTKNNLLPPPVKKKYSKDHILLLIFIYYYKNVLFFHDIEQLLKPITEHHFAPGSSPSLTEVYEEVFSRESGQKEKLMKEVAELMEESQSMFAGASDQERSDLQLFALISQLSYDVYMKKQIIEQLLDRKNSEETTDPPKRKKK